MQVADRIACSGYSYISPTVDRACKAVPLLGGIKQRIEPYAPPLLQKADFCIDKVYGVVEVPTTAILDVAKSARSKALYVKDKAYCVVDERATAVREAVTSTGGKAQKMIGESVVVARVHKTTLNIVDTLDMLIDRYLPDPEAKDGKDETKGMTPKDLIPRMLYIPYKIPVRMMRISIAKAQNGCHIIQVQIQWASKLTLDQKAKLQAFILSKSKALVDKASSSSLAITLHQGQQKTMKMLEDAMKSINASTQAAGVNCYIVLEKCHVIEMKDWLLRNLEAMHMAASQRAYNATSFAVGQERATGVFTLVGKRLPFVKIAVHASASTGALSDASSHEAEQSSTGATEKVSVPIKKADEADALPNEVPQAAATRQVSEVVEKGYFSGLL
jgi:hypothetical protein